MTMRLFGHHLGLVDWQQQTRLGAPGSAGVTAWTILSIASSAASAYHGSKRHGGSIGWGIAWGAVGAIFPVLTPAIGAAQGFGVCRYDCRERRR